MLYSIGIDLGTTNTCLAYGSLAAAQDAAPDEARIDDFAIPQVIAAGAVEPRPSLPSTLYVAGGPELPADSLHLPWRAETRFCIGAFARAAGARVPGRLVHSSKSWLCHPGIDRSAPILPWQGPDDVPKMSPVDVAVHTLEHLRDAWDATMAAGSPDKAMARQAVTLCVPASFDAEARNLTVEAAQRAGLENLHLLEEPQAALYAWVAAMGPRWRKQVRVGDLVLVVDVGGGTSDFSLIAVTEEDGELQLRRVAVGEHILLGGDNMDLALAFTLQPRIESERGIKLDAMQLLALVQQCREAKEALLGDASLDAAPITILGRGSSVVGGTIRTELKRGDVDQYLLAGFFPNCALGDRPVRPKRAGLREAGLPYASDGAITRHLARFLDMHQDHVRSVVPAFADAPAVLPTAILFNGGVFRSGLLRQRVVEVVGGWCAAAGFVEPRVLEGAEYDLAVARGAAYLGKARAGRGVRIRGGSPRSFYVGFEPPMPAVPGVVPPVKLLCVVPFGMEEGTTRDIDGAPIDLCLWKGEPVEFRFFSSTHRRADQPGQVLDHDAEHFEEHRPLETTVGTPVDGPEGEAVEVDLRAHLTEIGVLDLGVVERAGKVEHRLEFNVRAGDED